MKKFLEFLTEKGLTEEDFNKKSAEEMAELYNEYNEENRTALKAAIEAKASTESLEALKTQIVKTQNDQAKALNDTLKEQGLAIAKLMEDKNTSKKDKASSIMDVLAKNSEQLKSLKDSALKNLRLEIKAEQNASDITTGTDFAAMQPGVGQLAVRRTFIKGLFRTINLNSEHMKYNDQETLNRDAKNVAACAPSTHGSKITWQVRTLQMKKVRDFVDVCIDMLEDYDFVSAEIRNLISVDVALKVDEQLLLGTNTGDETNSISAVSSTFAAGVYSSTIQAATVIDLIAVCGGLIADAGANNKFMANAVLMNPADALLLKHDKDANNNYLLPNLLSAAGANIGGITVIANPIVPINEMYVMDSTKGAVVQRKNNVVEFSYENNDNFERELVTVKGYERLNFWVRKVDENAFLHVPDIDAALVAITV